MTTNHLLSTSLFSELFQHNMVSPDGFIIADEKQLENYYSFLVQQSKDRVSRLYVERKNMVHDVQKLFKKDVRSKEEKKLLQHLLKKLDLAYKDGEVHLKESQKRQKRDVGPKEPKMSLFEKEIDAELNRVQILKRDLRILDDWLDQITNIKPASKQHQEKSSNGKEAEKKFRQRTKNRMSHLQKARGKLIKQYYNDYDRNLQRILDPMSFTRKTHLRGKADPSSPENPSERTDGKKFKPEIKGNVTAEDKSNTAIVNDTPVDESH